MRFDVSKWRRQGRPRIDGKRAHLDLDPETGATVAVVEQAGQKPAHRVNETALLQFVRQIARLETGTEMDKRGEVMEGDDAYETLNDLIEQARGLTGGA